MSQQLVPLLISCRLNVYLYHNLIEIVKRETRIATRWHRMLLARYSQKVTAAFVHRLNIGRVGLEFGRSWRCVEQSRRWWSALRVEKLTVTYTLSAYYEENRKNVVVLIRFAMIRKVFYLTSPNYCMFFRLKIWITAHHCCFYSSDISLICFSIVEIFLWIFIEWKLWESLSCLHWFLSFFADVILMLVFMSFGNWIEYDFFFERSWKEFKHSSNIFMEVSSCCLCDEFMIVEFFGSET